MSDGSIGVDPRYLESGSKALDNLSRRADSIRSTASDAAGISPLVWGMLGEVAQLPGLYNSLGSHVLDHLHAISEGLGSHSAKLHAAARDYRRTDDDAAASFGPATSTSGVGSDGGPPSVNLGGLVHLGPDAVAPVKDVYDLSQQSSTPDVGAIIGDVGDLALNGVGFLADPFGWLAGSAFSFLLTVFPPLEDLLGMVTGNARRIGEHAETWSKTGRDLRELAADIDAAVRNHLLSWHGETGATATDRLHRFAQGVVETADQTDDRAAVLTASGTLMTIAQGFVTDEIVSLIEKLVEKWILATAADAVVPGAELVAMEETVRDVATTTTKCAHYVAEVDGILDKIKHFLNVSAVKTLDGAASLRKLSSGEHGILRGQWVREGMSRDWNVQGGFVPTSESRAVTWQRLGTASSAKGSAVVNTTSAGASIAQRKLGASDASDEQIDADLDA
jgi:uncharacterized protein YukE